MNNNRLRLVFFALLILLLAMFVNVLLGLTHSTLDLWHRIAALSPLMQWIYGVAVVFCVGFACYLMWRLFFAQPKTNKQPLAKMDEQQLRQELDTLNASGQDTTALEEEFLKLNQRNDAGEIDIAFFGNINTGKSALIKALLPNAEIESSPVGGSTNSIDHYIWRASSGDQLRLTDLPGRNEWQGEMEQAIHEESLRAHIVVYVLDNDLTRSQKEDVLALAEYGKPLIVAFNKSDQYRDEERKQIKQRLHEHLKPHFDKKTMPQLVFTQGGGARTALVIGVDGQTEEQIRPGKIEVDGLTKALQDLIDGRADWLAQLRNASVFTLIQHKLDHARQEQRQKEAKAIVNSATKKAMIGAMAAVSPGTDLVIQGVIGTTLIRDLCKLYDSPVAQLDIDQFFDFSQGLLKKSIPLVLAVAGNGLKAFPGIGTVAGGLVHAVAYGLIFDALGRAAIMTLEARGQLKAAPAAMTFQTLLEDNLQTQSKRFAKMVVERAINKDSLS